jgi:APA family basic amino acid/polyamine antiporter
LKKAEKHGLFGAIMMGLGSAIGFEIFGQLGYAYSLAQASMVFALFLGGLICLLTMFSYSELCAALPVTGGEYSYTKAAFGGFTAFMTGCLRWLSSIFGAAFAALVFAQQLSFFLSILLSLDQNHLLAYTNLIAAILVFILGALSVRGVKEITTFLVGAFLAIFALFLISGFWQGQAVPEVLPQFEGLSGVFATTAYTFIMFVGIRAIVAGAPEIKDPEKNIPKAIFLSMVLLIALYCSVAYVAVSAVGQEEFAESTLLNFAAEKIMGLPGGALVAIAGMVASISSVSTAIMVQSSIVRGMGRDGYLPKVLLTVHKRFGTPHVAVVANSFFVVLLAAIGAAGFLGYAASFASILVFVLVNLSVMKLRENRPHLERPLKAPLYPITPIIGIAMSLMLLVFPIFLGDVNAENAIMSSFGLMGLVLATYHLRMMGIHRLRIALGGISLGMGFFAALLAYLIEKGFKPLVLPLVPPYILVFVSVVSILAGVLNIVVGIRKLF